MNKKWLSGTIMFIMVVTLVLTALLASEPQTVQAKEVCEEYVAWSSVELYAQHNEERGQDTHETTLKFDRPVPPGEYRLYVTTGDNHRPQSGQDKEQVTVFGKTTPDLPMNSQLDPDVWVKETWSLGTITVNQTTPSTLAIHAYAWMKIGPQSITIFEVKLVRCFQDLVESTNGNCTEGFTYGINNNTPYGARAEGTVTFKDEQGVTEYPFSLSVAAGEKDSITIPWGSKPFGKSMVSAVWSRSWSNSDGQYDSGELDCGGQDYTTYAEVTCAEAEARVDTNVPGTLKWVFKIDGSVVNSGSKHVTGNDSESYAWGLSEGTYDLYAESIFVPDDPGLDSSKDVDEKNGENCGEEPPPPGLPLNCHNVKTKNAVTGEIVPNGSSISQWGFPGVFETFGNGSDVVLKTNGVKTDSIPTLKEVRPNGYLYLKIRPSTLYEIYYKRGGQSGLSGSPDCTLYFYPLRFGKSLSFLGGIKENHQIQIQGESISVSTRDNWNTAMVLGDGLYGLHNTDIYGNAQPGSLLAHSEPGDIIKEYVNGIPYFYQVVTVISLEQDEYGYPDIPLEMKNSAMVLTSCDGKWLGEFYSHAIFVAATQIHIPVYAQ